MAVASLSQAYPAEVVSLGTLGTRQCALATLVRQLQAQSPHLVFVSAAGPCGYWLARSRTNKGQVCWGVAPSVLPQKPGERVKPHRRDASTLARLMRSGALPPSLSPRSQMPLGGTWSAPVQRPCGLSRPPRVGCQRCSCGTLSALRARPIGARRPSGGSARGAAPWGGAPFVSSRLL
jgi:hypothetical protein